MENDPVQTIPFNDGFVLKIFVDQDPLSPRELDNLGTMVCFHKRYNLGDDVKKHGYRSQDFGGWHEFAETIHRQHDPFVILPLYLYDHSGITISVRDFSHCDSAGWDWGQVGFVFVSKEDVFKEYGKDVLPERVENILKGEVDTYDQYLTGDIYGFELHGPPCDKCNSEGEVVDSCSGFYGDDPVENGMVEHLSDEYRKELLAIEPIVG